MVPERGQFVRPGMRPPADGAKPGWTRRHLAGARCQYGDHLALALSETLQQFGRNLACRTKPQAIPDGDQLTAPRAKHLDKGSGGDISPSSVQSFKGGI